MPDTDPKKFYLTTPIYYVNARPHIGHAYTTIVADVLARRHRLLGDDTFFLTGTDEHGQKIERSAAAAGIPPQQFADQVSAEFRRLWDRMGLTYDRYIRTTDPHHIQGAQKLFADLYARGQIYLSSYTGQYSIGEEMFVEGPPGTIGPDGRPTETVTEENFFFRLSDYQLPLLNLIESGELAITPESSRNEVLSFIRSGLRDLSVSRSSFTWGVPVPDDILHAAGTTQKHVIYVWLDALANYMTAIGYGSDSPKDRAEFARYWPADLHLVGKEITRFHCVYWPAFLLALNPALLHSTQTAPPNDTVILSEASQPYREAESKDPRISPVPPQLSMTQHPAWAAQMLPQQITAHGWLLFDNSKMSKSKGNIVRTETILDAFGDHVYAKQFPDSTKNERDLFASDVLRYFLLREIPFGQDGSFSFEALVTRYNADLANGYGNLVSRTLSMVGKYCGGVIPTPPPVAVLLDIPSLLGPPDKETKSFGYGTTSLITALEGNLSSLRQYSKETDFGWLLLILGTNIKLSDGYLTHQAPWKIAAGTNGDTRRSEILYTTSESIRIITALLYPILPYATARVWSQLGLGDIELAARNGKLNNLQWGDLKPGTKLGPLAPIFPRADKGLAQIMTDMEEQNSPATGNSKLETESRSPSPEAPPTSTTHPAAPPRTSSLAEPTATLPVGGSTALTTGPQPIPSHTEVPASGIFANQPTPPTSDSTTPQITIDDFAKIDLRVAQVLVAEKIPKADKLLRLEVDLGPELGRRQILSGIAEWYTPEDLIGRRIVVITNLAPRKMRGLESHGMLLAASADDPANPGKPGKPILATMAEDIALGSRLK